MELLVASSVGLMTAVGIYLILRMRSFPVIVGLTMISYACNVFIFASGRIVAGLPPIRVEVRSLAWMCYETRHIGGPLRTLRVFDLRRASLDEVAPPA